MVPQRWRAAVSPKTVVSTGNTSASLKIIAKSNGGRLATCISATGTFSAELSSGMVLSRPTWIGGVGGPYVSWMLPQSSNDALEANALISLHLSKYSLLRALAGKEKALGAEHTSTLDTVNNLGVLYRDQCKLAEAEQMYSRALAGYEKALGAEHTSTLNTVNNLGALYSDQGRLVEMIDLGSTRASRAVNLFGKLGRLMLQNRDDSNAQTAFQQEINFQDGCPGFANIQCDGCGLPITYAKKRFVCRHCSDGDLCGQCFHEHQAGIRRVPNCLNHSFLAIISDSSSEAEPAIPFVETRRVLWFQDLGRQYVL